MTDFDWTEKQVERFKAMHATGDSFGIIADAMGISRNSVVGKAHRLGLKRDIEDRPNRPPRRQKSRAHKTIYKHGPPKRKGSLNEVALQARLTGESPKFELPAERVADQDIPHGQRRMLLDLTNETCRWPVGDPGTEGFFFCGAGGADLDRGHPYCQAHRALAYNGKPQRGAPFIPRWAA